MAELTASLSKEGATLPVAVFNHLGFKEASKKGQESRFHAAVDCRVSTPGFAVLENLISHVARVEVLLEKCAIVGTVP